MPLSNTDENSPSTESATAPAAAAPVLVYPDPLSADDSAGYADLRRESAWFESANQWSTFRGPKAADALNGLVTNDVTQLRPGEGQHAAALTPKGKLLCDMLIFRMDDETFMLALPHSCAAQWLATARKYVNPRLAKVEDESEKWTTWMLYGAQASAAVTSLRGADHPVEALSDVMVPELAAWTLWQHGLWNIGPATVRLIRAPLMGSMPGFLILADARDADVVREHLEQSEYRHATSAVWNIAQVEGGRLRGLLGTSAMPLHGPIVDASGKVVGDVRSTVMSPRLGPIAIAMLRREVQEGDTVIVEGSDGPITAEVRELPFAE